MAGPLAAAEQVSFYLNNAYFSTIFFFQTRAAVNFCNDFIKQGSTLVFNSLNFERKKAQEI